MDKVKRRRLLMALGGTLPLPAWGQGAAPRKAVLVGSGKDRYGQARTIGSHVTNFKVASDDARGGLFVMENHDTTQGGPPRHLHHREDEWFYVIEGDYVFEVGAERFELKGGDSLLAPREIPHAYAFVVRRRAVC